MNLNKLFRDENVMLQCFTVGTAAFFYLFSRETVGLKYYIKFLTKFNENNEPVPVENVLKFRYHNILDDMKISEWNRKYYDLFIVKHLDPVFIGSTKTRYGIKIGIPEYFQHGTEESIINSKILIDKKPVKWNSAEGNAFLKSLRITKDAQKFIIAKMTNMCDSYYFLLNSLVPMLALVGYYSGCSRIYNKFKLHHRPISLTLTLHTVMGFVFIAIYVFLKDGLYFQYEKVAEDKVFNLGESYIIGGIEYYTHRIEKNKALRNLVKNGHKYYTVGGNEMSVWRMKTLPDTYKLQLAKERLNKYSTDKELLTPPPVNPNPHPIL